VIASLARAYKTRDDAAASTASRPAFRDDREPPLLVGRDARIMPVIWVGVKAYSENRNYFVIPRSPFGAGLESIAPVGLFLQ
jgi:hypothetical protein